MESNVSTQNQNNSEKPLGTHYEHKIGESFKSKALKFLVWALRVKHKPLLVKKLQTGENTAREVPEPPQKLKNNFEFASWQVDGHNVFSFSPKENKTKKQVLFLHGGAYVNTNTEHHWNFIEAFVRETQCTMIVPDYPLAPSHTYIDAYKCVEQVYKKLIEDVDPRDVIVMGDSAGGGFALGLVQKFKNDGVTLPAHTILLSPWLDVRLKHPEIAEVDKDEVLLNLEALKMAGEHYTKGGDINSYMVCPIEGPIEGLGKIHLFIGTHDILWPDCKEFKKRCNEKGVAIDYYEYPKMAHDWMLMSMAEGEHVIQQIKTIIA